MSWVRAIYNPEPEQWRQYRSPGSFILIPRPTAGLFEMRFFCPTGADLENSLLIGEGFKPGGDRPSWRWNGSRSEPTLDPSVNIEGHWHGWLRGGYWRAV
jgi:hypothetical protein